MEGDRGTSIFNEMKSRDITRFWIGLLRDLENRVNLMDQVYYLAWIFTFIKGRSVVNPKTFESSPKDVLMYILMYSRAQDRSNCCAS